MCLRAIRVVAVGEVFASLQNDLLRALLRVLSMCLIHAYVRYVSLRWRGLFEPYKV